MGNTPTQQPFEGDSSDPGEPDAGAPIWTRLRGAVRSAATGLRRRLSVFSNLDFGSAFTVEERADTKRHETEAVVDLPRTTDRELPDPETGAGGATKGTGSEFPARDVPLTRPARDRGAENGPDLEAEEENGRLAIYYPERSEAKITSDTWREVER